MPRVGENPVSLKRRFLFPFLTLALVLAGFAALELVLAVLHIGDPESTPDPLIGFTEIRPLFLLDEDGANYRTAPSRKIYFNPESFEAKKSEDEFRIFCLGGSTVAGRPYAIATSFTTWMEIGLRVADPSRKWNVVNCGGVSYASYRLVPILQEVLQYDPDLIVLYTGHNEFLEDRTYRTIKHLPPIVAKPIDWGSQLRTFQLLSRLVVSERTRADAKKTLNTLPVEVEARLDFKNGLKDFDRDPVWREGVIDHYGKNLRKMVDAARTVSVPIVLVNPGCNLRDCPPFKSLPGEGLTDEERERFRSLSEEARWHYRDDPNRSAALLLDAVKIDPENAAAQYELGKCLDAVGRVEEARHAFLQAKERDVCPLRILEPMNRTILEVANRNSLPLVDAKALLESDRPEEIPGNDVYIDHVHPTIGSHEKIGIALVEKLIEMGIADPTEDWRAECDTAFADHIASLDDLYFAKGMDRLERLRSWAAGQSDLPPSVSLRPKE